jgi:hypothetical protein
VFFIQRNCSSLKSRKRPDIFTCGLSSIVCARHTNITRMDKTARVILKRPEERSVLPDIERNANVVDPVKRVFNSKDECK